MLKKTISLSFLLLFFVLKTHCQKDTLNLYQVQYERVLSVGDGITPFVSIYEYTKFIEFNKSIYNRKNKIETTKNLIEGDESNTVLYFTPKGKNISVVYKDYETRELHSKHEVAYKYFVVKDSLDIFNWEILNESKEILGYTCQLATMNFRGRKYEAWFSSKLPVGGPWKYDGLPGLILEMKSLDNFISFKAISLKNLKFVSKTLKNPFETKDAITWQEFTTLYKKKAIELISYRPVEGSAGIESSKGGIEIYIKEDDKEYNEALKKIRGNN